MAAPKSYKDPLYTQLAAANEKRFGLPSGLLQDIILKGERSDADAVSEAGARGVAQVIPATRKAAIEKWKIDPYLSPENNIEVAARLLKDSLDRNGGDAAQAIAEYHGGTDRSNWGPKTRAYVRRVTGQNVSRDGSTFERAKAAREQDAGPSIASVYEAHRAGTLPPDQEKAFTEAVNRGEIVLPRNASLKTAPGSVELKPGVLAAYASREGMTDEDRAQLDELVSSGAAHLPKGATLNRPAPLTAGQSFGLGVRNVATGLAGVADIVANPVSAIADAVIPGDVFKPNPTRTGVDALADMAGLPRPVTPAEKLTQGIIEGAAGGMATAGLGMVAGAAPGAVGAVGRALAAAPVVDTLSGAASGASSALAANAGAGPGMQMLAGLAGGVAGAGASARIAQRFGARAAKVVSSTPREVLLDEAGELTDEGAEMAARAGVKKEDLAAAYEEAAKPEPATQTVRTHEGTDYPVEVIDPTPVADAEGVPHIKVRGEDGAEGFVPAEEVRVVPVQEPTPAATAPAPTEAASPAEAPLPASAAARVDQAASEGVDITRAQATRDFAAQEAEGVLKASGTSEGNQARAWEEKQQGQIAEAVDRFKASVGDPTLSAEQRGAQVKDAIRDLRDSGRAGVKAVYEQAEELEKAAKEAGNVVTLDATPLLGRLREVFIDEGVEEGVRKSLRQQAAKYGLIGENPRTVEGETTVQLRDQAGEPAGTIKFTGPQEPLTIGNAFRFRERLNKLFRQDTTGVTGELKQVLDDAISEAVERASAKEGEVGAAYQQGIAAHKEQMRTFKAKDIVQRIADWKKGTQTELLAPERVIAEIFGAGKDAVTNLKKVKAVLLNKPTETSRAAWQAIQAHGVATIFDGAVSPRGDISGLRLNTAIKKFGAAKLRVLLPEADFNQLMKLQRIIGDATIPLANTGNASHSGYRVINFLTAQARALAPLANLTGVGQVANLVGPLIKQARAAATAKATLEGVTGFTPEAAAKADARVETSAAKAEERLKVARDFIDLAKGERLVAPLLTSTGHEASQ